MKNSLDQQLDIQTYFDDYNSVLREFLDKKENRDGLMSAIEILKQTRKDGTKIVLVGNGGSSAVAEHMAIDFIKNVGLQALTISGSPMLTTFSNDYGYEKVFQKGIEILANNNDVLIAISSSGTSKNILNACDAAKAKNMQIITLSGFSPDNPLRKKGNINFWVNSKAFGYVELIHNLILHYMSDAIIGSAEYMIR